MAKFDINTFTPVINTRGGRKSAISSPRTLSISRAKKQPKMSVSSDLANIVGRTGKVSFAYVDNGDSVDLLIRAEPESFLGGYTITRSKANGDRPVHWMSVPLSIKGILASGTYHIRDEDIDVEGRAIIARINRAKA